MLVRTHVVVAHPFCGFVEKVCLYRNVVAVGAWQGPVMLTRAQPFAGMGWLVKHSIGSKLLGYGFQPLGSSNGGCLINPRNIRLMKARTYIN